VAQLAARPQHVSARVAQGEALRVFFEETFGTRGIRKNRKGEKPQDWSPVLQKTLQKQKRPDKRRGAENRQGYRPTLQKKASSAKPGRTFLHE